MLKCRPVKARPSLRKAKAERPALASEAPVSVDWAALAETRHKNALDRLLVTAAVGLIATAVLGAWAPVFWYAAFLGAMIVERRFMRAIHAAAQEGRAPNMPLLATWTFVQSAIGGAIAPIIWLMEPRHGDALAALALISGLFNALLTLRGSTLLMAAGMAPGCLYLVAIPFVELRLRGGGDPMIELAPAFAVLLLTWNALTVWRSMRAADAAMLRTQEAVLEARRAVKEAAGARADFIALMRQEIRTPMAALTGAAESLRRRELPAEARLEANTLIDSSELIAAVLDDLVDLENIASGRVRIETRPTDPRALVRSVASAFRAQAEEKGLEFFVDISEQTPARVVLDGLRVRQVLYNLVSNALKFTQNGGVRVRLQAAPSARDGYVRLGFAVADTGVGMSRAELAAALGEAGQGATPKGLGLAISAKLARLMGARLGAKSAPQQGSLFSLVIEAEIVEASTETAPSQSAPRVLVVQARPHERRVMAAILDATALRYDMAESGARAIEMLTQSAYDLVIADQRTDDLDAFDIAALLNEDGRDARTRVIAMLDVASPAMRAECAAHHVAGCIALPLTAPGVIDEITRVLGAAPPAASWAA